MSGITGTARGGILNACLTVAVCSCTGAIAAAPETRLTEAGEALAQRYDGVVKALQGEITGALPLIPASDWAALQKARAAVALAEKESTATPTNQVALAALALAQTNEQSAAKVVLAKMDPFLAGDPLDAKLVKCALMLRATPQGLAEFAQQGSEQEALVEKLLADPVLMDPMLEAGGARGGRYGDADLYRHSEGQPARPRGVRAAPGAGYESGACRSDRARELVR
jgi:hypothetical protein